MYPHNYACTCHATFDDTLFIFFLQKVTFEILCDGSDIFKESKFFFTIDGVTRECKIFFYKKSYMVGLFCANEVNVDIFKGKEGKLNILPRYTIQYV